MEEKELIEHRIEVDEFIEIRIKIPKIIDVVSFGALLQKTNKLMKLSEIQVPKVTFNRGKYKGVDTDNLLKEYENSNKEERQKIAEKYGFVNLAALQNKIYDIRKRKGISIKSVKGKSNRVYDDKKINKAIELVKEGKEMKDIAKEVGIDRKKLYDTIRGRTGKGIQELRG